LACSSLSGLSAAGRAFIIFFRRQKCTSFMFMYIKPEFVEAFKQATIENATNNVKEAASPALT
jgi:hypothetical protein